MGGTEGDTAARVQRHALSLWSCVLAVLRQLPVRLVGDLLEPFVGDVLAGDDECDVGEPRVGLRAVPVLGAGRHPDHRPRLDAH